MASTPYLSKGLERDISTKLLDIMSTELLSSEINLDTHGEDGNHVDDRTLKNMEQEIECPRCYDIMTLSFRL